MHPAEDPVCRAVPDSILVICQEFFEKDFDMFFRKKGNFNRPSAEIPQKPNVSSG